ncbi:hypothetical protein LguiA_015685 [Lonicera macranthoides]
MSSDLSVFDDSFFTDPFPCNFNIDSPTDILHAIHNYNNNINHPTLESLTPVDEIETNPLHQISPAILFSSSPPSSQLENLSFSQTTHLENSPSGYVDSNDLGVKQEEFQFPFQSNSDFQGNCVPYSYGGAESTMKMEHRSYSSHSFDGINPSFMYQPQFSTPMESPNFDTFVSSSPGNSLFTGQLRKACSTGDLHKMSSPLGTESSFMEETNSKVAPYNAQQRKQRIHRYREKRNHRNFNKTIKYACRKTLADNRARIRGRFARNDETTAEIPTDATATTLNPFPHEGGHCLWMKGFCEGYDSGSTVGRAPLLNTYAATQLQFCGY